MAVEPRVATAAPSLATPAIPSDVPNEAAKPDSPETDREPSAERGGAGSPAETVRAYGDGAPDSGVDTGQVCALTSASFRSDMEAESALSCPEAIQSVRDMFGDVDMGEVRRDSDGAVLDLSLAAVDYANRSDESYRLVVEDGAWVIDAVDR